MGENIIMKNVFRQLLVPLEILMSKISPIQSIYSFSKCWALQSGYEHEIIQPWINNAD